MDCGRKMMVFLFLYSVVELGNAAVVDNCPISADEREMRIKEFFRKDPAVCNHNETYHCIPLLDDTSFNGFYEGCLEHIVIEKDGCIDAANVSGKIFLNEIQTPCNISCCPMPGTKYKSSELYKYPACYQNVSSRSSYSCPVVSMTAETTAVTTMVDNTSPTGLFTRINSTVTPSPKNTGIIIGLSVLSSLAIIIILIILISCWRIEWCKKQCRERHFRRDPLPQDDTLTHYVKMGQSCQLSRNLEGSSECQWYKNGIRVTEGIRNDGRVSLLTVTVSSFNTTYQSKVNDVTEHHTFISDDGEAENENVNSSGPQDQTDSRADIDSETTIPNNTIGQETPEPGTSYMNREEIRTGEKAISPGIDGQLDRIIKDKEQLIDTIETVVTNLKDMNEKALSEDEDIKESVRNVREKCCSALHKIRESMFGIGSWMNHFTDLLNKLPINNKTKDIEDIKCTSIRLEHVAQKCCSEFEECCKKLNEVCNYIKDENNTYGFDKQGLCDLIKSLQSLYENWCTISIIFSDTTKKVDSKLLSQSECMKERAEKNLCIRKLLLQVHLTAKAFSEFADGFVKSYDEKIRKLVVDLTKPYSGYARRPQLEQRVDSIPRDNENDELEESLKNGEKR